MGILEDLALYEEMKVGTTKGFRISEVAENVVENESQFSLEVVDDGLSSSGGRFEGRFGEHYGGNGGIGGSMFGVGEGKDESIGGMRGGSLARCSMVSNDGWGGGGLVLAGGRSLRESRKD
ncbi:hypothetical protein Tco_1402599 [Tanacetum coccineum]